MAGNLSLEDRIIIQAMRDNGHKAIEISNYLNRNKTTIYREISKTKSSESVYDAHFAHRLTSANMVRVAARGPSVAIVNLIERKILNDQWSPEQISGWLKLEHNISISHTWIYKYVDKDRHDGGELFNHMRHGQYSKGHVEYHGKIPDRTSIEARPEFVNQRSRIGDCEIDLIVGTKNQGAILSIIERVSRYCFLQKLENKKTETVVTAVINGLRQLNCPVFTVTSDNGTEFTNHKTISETLDLKYYFAHPYASYERGSIENLNGLVRQYIPKGTDFSEIEPSNVKHIQDKLNSRPRKVLNYLTPNQYLGRFNNKFGEEKLQLRV